MDFDLLAGLPDSSEVVPLTEEGKLDQLTGIREELFVEHARILRDVARFRDIDPKDELPPQEWMLQMGSEEAWKMFRIARASWINAKDAPVGLKISAQIVTGAMKAMAAENKNMRALNIQVVQIIAPGTPEPSFPELEVGDG